LILMYGAPAVADPERVTFPSGDGECVGWLYRPVDGDPEPFPVVVLAHGFPATHLLQYARRAAGLAESGLGVFDFDPRRFGVSPGEPRQRLVIRDWLEDLRSAVAYVRRHPSVDADAIGILGGSLGGGLAIDVAASDERIAALALAVPHLDGMKNNADMPLRTRLRFVRTALGDRVGRMVGRQPRKVLVFGSEAEGALVTEDLDSFLRVLDEIEGVEWVVPQRWGRHPELGEWRNETLAWEALSMAFYRPVRRVPLVRCPTLIELQEDDGITPFHHQRRVLDAIPDAQLLTRPGGHFEPFYGEGFESSVRAEADFFRRALARRDRPESVPAPHAESAEKS
jgi:uncharacterized protein